MKKFLSLGLSVILTAGLATSCKDDVLNSGEEIGGNSGGYVDDGQRMYVTAGIALPSIGTRSATEDSGYTPGTGNNQTNSDVNGENVPDYELGYDYENNVRSVLLVFANKDNKYVAHSVVNGISKAPNTGGSSNGVMSEIYDVSVTAEIKHVDLEKAYTTGLLGTDNKIVYVYAFCNPTARMIERFNIKAENGEDPYNKDAEWYDWEGIVEEDPSPAGYTPLTQNSIWAGDSFLMSNAEPCEIQFPATIGEWDEYSDKSHPFFIAEKGEQDGSLKPIKVERVAARIDFKDGSNDSKGRPNTYPLYVDSNRNNEIGDAGDLNIISVQLNRMCLVNMSKNYFYLRRISNSDPASNDNKIIGGVEKKTNFVVDYDWQDKLGNLIKADKKDSYNEDEYFNFPLYTFEVQDEETDDNVKYNRYGWYTDRIQEDLLESSNHSSDTWKGSEAGGGYKIWRYVTENTLPSVNSQKTVQSTGVVFKGRIVEGADIEKPDASKYISQTVIDAIKAINASDYDPVRDASKTPYLYSYNNILYGGHEEFIEKANADGNNGPLHQVANAILAHWVLTDKADGETGDCNNTAATKIYKYKAKPGPNDEVMTVQAWARMTATNPEKFDDGTQRDYIIDENDFLNNAAPADVVVYRPYNEDELDINGDSLGDGWGYYCYYFYWNRHNDNSKSGVMGPMEFATVRNNVYKLSVSSIGKLGHPRLRQYDPDPVDPEDPDEDPINYIKVQVNVLPWVVRENKITF